MSIQDRNMPLPADTAATIILDSTLILIYNLHKISIVHDDHIIYGV
jgi:hypothetical protein